MMKIMPLLNILVNLQWSGRYNIDWLIGHIPFTLGSRFKSYLIPDSAHVPKIHLSY